MQFTPDPGLSLGESILGPEGAEGVGQLLDFAKPSLDRFALCQLTQ